MAYGAQTSGIIDHAFLRNLYNGMQGYGVVTGMTPSVTGSSMVVSIAAGSVRTASGPFAYAGGSVTLSNGHATLPRTDWVIWDDSADTIAKLEGTPTAESATQSKPPGADLADANDLLLAMVYVGAATTTIPSNQLFDRRITVPSSSTTVFKTSDESVTSSITLQDDNELTIAMAANTKYLVEGAFEFTAAASGDIKVGFNGPASSTLAILTWGLDDSDVTDSDTQTVYDTPQNYAGAGSTPRIVKASGRVTVGATAGNLVVRWAQNASSGTATVMKTGSWLRLQAAG